MKKEKFLFVSGLCACLAMPFVSCDNDDVPTPVTPQEKTTGVYILNAGKFNSNNATLDFYDPETKELTPKVFSSVNGRGLGDTANDMLIYGSKMYIAVSTSATIEVTDLSGKSLQVIKPVDEAGTPQQPRTFAAYKGNVYVTLFDGHLACIDTTTLNITQKVPVGPNPEGVCEANGKLYVANSGGYNAVADSTLSVIDAASFTVLDEVVKVAVNPGSLMKDSDGDVYIVSQGNYSTIPACLQRMDAKTGKVSVLVSDGQLKANICNDKLYLISSEYGEKTNWLPANTKYLVYDAKTEQKVSDSFITDGTKVENPSFVSIDPATNTLYLMAGGYVNTGDVYIFSPEGKLVNKVGVSGINPMGAFFVLAK